MPRLPGLRRTIEHKSSAASVRRDVDDEIAYHLDAVTQELMAGGMDATTARRTAEARFGNLDAHRDALRQADGATARRARWRNLLVDTVSDLRYAVRGLRREPLFTLGAVVTLAIGLAANTTMFGVIDRLLLQPPPHVRDDGRLSLVYFQAAGGEGHSFVQASKSYPDYVMLRDSSGVVESAAAFWTNDRSLGVGPEARKIQVGLATGNFFTTLGTRAALGRTFGPAEDDPASTETPAVLSDALWRNVYGADPAVIGRVVQLNDRAVTIVGVLPRGFNGASTRPTDLWVPMRATASAMLGSTEWETSRNWYWLRIVARLRPGVTNEEAALRATVVHQAANRAEKTRDSSVRVLFGPLQAARGAGVSSAVRNGGLTDQARVAVWLAGVAGVVLLIVCANLANLLLSRAARRRREIAVRLALGVRRGRLVRQFLGETLVLCALAALLAVALSFWGSTLMRQTLLSDMAWDGSPVNARLLSFTALATLVTCLVAGWLPAWLASRQDLTGGLKASARGGGFRRTALQRSLLIAQAALSVVLLCGAGLFVRSLRNVATMRMGYDTEQVLVADVDVSAVIKGDTAQATFWQSALEAIRSVPGVTSASLGVTTPFNSSWATGFALPGRDTLPEITDGPYVNAVTHEYLTTLGMRVLRGRGFEPTDVKGSERVAVVNDFMARVLWPGKEAVGQCIKVGADTAPCTTVVGIIENYIRDNVREEAGAQYLVLQEQGTFDVPGMRSLFVRAAGDPAVVGAAVQKRLQGMRPDLPYTDVRTISTLMANDVRPWRLGATMFGLFGVIALVVAAIGLYAVIAYDVTQRWHEFGVRAALGARPQHLVRLILGDGVRHACAGLLVGLAIAWMLAPQVKTMLFRVEPRDGTTLGAVAAVLLVVSVLACLLPARRAARLEPTEAIRTD